MSARALIFWGMLIGGVIGGYVPVLFGAGLLSYISIMGNAVGSLAGIYVGYKLSNY